MKIVQTMALGLICVALGAGLQAWLIPKLKHSPTAANLPAVEIPKPSNNPCVYVIKWLPGFSYTRPLVFAEPECESISYAGLHLQIDSLIEVLKKKGILEEASVYLRDFNRGEWMSVNDTNLYIPGSLLKLPLLLALMKEQEANPGILNQTLKFSGAEALANLPPQTFEKQVIRPQQSYTLHDLAQAMIEHSDNGATYLIHQKVPFESFQKVFGDLDLRLPLKTEGRYLTTARQVSVFLKSVYNGTYLSRPNSERVAYLLTLSAFKKGICAGLPLEIGTAHKFGESGTKARPELHETALVYLPGSPYLITVMTRGSQIEKLPSVLAEISRLCYRFMEKSAEGKPHS